MKRILLTSTALVAFAGAAAAEGHTSTVFTGSATLGYNDIGELAPATAETDDGFYWDAELGVLASAALNGGLTASAEYNIEVANGGTGVDLESGDFVLKLASDTASIAIGDLDPVAEDRWDGVDGSTVADFNDQDVHFSDAVGFEAMLVGEATIAGFTAAVSYGVDADGNT
ncbi:MAG: porin, partial [Paracoccaceae bacterium]